MNAVATAQGQGFIDDGFQGQLLAAAHLVVGGNDDFGAGVLDAVTQTLRRETAKHHRVRGTNARTGLHGGHTIDRHRDVDDDSVTFDNAQGLQHIGVLACFNQQFFVTGAGDLSIIGFKNDGSFIAQTAFDIAV